MWIRKQKMANEFKAKNGVITPNVEVTSTTQSTSTTTGALVVAGGIGAAGNVVAGGNVTVTGNVSAGNVSATALTGTLTTASQPNITSVGTLTSLAVTGNVSAGNVSATALTGTLSTASQPNITSVGTLTSLAVTGNVSAGNVTVTGNVSATNVSGVLTTASQPNITSVGTLTSLAVTGNVTAGNVSATNVSGVLTTASQPNITSVGTLTSLAVTGNATAGNTLFGSSTVYTLASGVPRVQTHTTGVTALDIVSWASSATHNIGLGKSRSGTIGTRGAVQTGDAISLDFRFDDGAAFQAGARIQANTIANASANTVSAALVFHTANASNSTSEVMRISHDGKVGVGTNSPTAKLHVIQTGSEDSFRIDDQSSDNTPFVVETDGAVTIGYSSRSVTPLSGVSSSKLTIVSSTSESGVMGARFSADGSPAEHRLFKSRGATIGTPGALVDNDGVGRLRAFGDDGSGTGFPIASIDYNVDGTPATGSVPGEIVFGTTGVGNSATTARMVINSSGNVGVGTTVPTSTFEVSGNVKATNYLDVNLIGDLNIRSGIGLNPSIYTGNDAGGALHIGKSDFANATPYVDFHSNGANRSARIIASGGTSSQDSGNLSIQSANLNIPGVVRITNNTTSTTTTTGALVVTGGVGMNTHYTNTSRMLNTNAVGLASSSHALQIGSNGGTNLAFDPANIQARNNGAASSLVLNPLGGTVSVGADFVVAGNLQVNGTTTTINATTLDISDLNITVAKNATTSTQANGGGITVAGANAQLYYDSVSNSWVSTHAIQANISGATTTAQTVTNNAQPNITSVGTLTSLAVTGNVSAGNVSATNVSGVLTTASQPNITSVGTLTSLAVTGNVSAGNVTVTGNVSATNVSGVLTTASQPNITSVGTLTSLAVTGNVTAGNVTVSTMLTANDATITDTTVSTSTTTGALTVAGGVGVAGNLYLGGGANFAGIANLTNTGAATSATTGALRVAGGMGLAGNLVSGQNLAATSTTSGAARFIGNIAGLGVRGNVWAGQYRGFGLKVQPVSNVGAPTGAASATGGTIAAGTYFARIVAVAFDGSLTGAANVSSGVTTTGSTSSITWTWAQVDGAASYRVYVGTSAASQTSFFTVTGPTGTFVQTTTTGTATTQPIVENLSGFSSFSAPINIQAFTSTEGGQIILAYGNQTSQVGETASSWSIDVGPGAQSNVSSTANAFRIFSRNDSNVDLRLLELYHGSNTAGLACLPATVRIAEDPQCNNRDAIIEIGRGRTGNGASYVDFHSTIANVDYDGRVISQNGDMSMICAGAGGLKFIQEGTGNTLWITKNGTGFSECMRLTNDGRLEINTATPIEGFALSVNGKAFATSFRALGGDPQSSDSANVGFSFGQNGDTGLFTIANVTPVPFETTNVQSPAILCDGKIKMNFGRNTGGGINDWLQSHETLVPAFDNSFVLGQPSLRWAAVYSATGTIQTSDGNLKTEIQSVDEAEHAVALQLKSMIKKFKFTEAVETKGSENARVHFGVIAQDVEATFIAAGLDPTKYGLFCKDVWFEDESGAIVDESTPGATRVERLGIRYDELFALIISAL